jgi:hypothetical protein
VKFVALVAVPSESVTAIGPVVAPAGTVAVIWTLESTLNVAGVPSNVTAVTALESLKPVPAISTEVPIGPLAGSNDVIVGAVACATPMPMNDTMIPAAKRTAVVRAASRRTTLVMPTSPSFLIQ